jgi:hypothetical protein
MQFFLNELTLQEQYLSGRDFEHAIICLLSTAKQIQEIDYPKELFSDKTNLAGFKPVAGKFLHESLSEVDVSLRGRFKRFIYETSDDWRKDQKHSATDIFAIGTHNVTDRSAAELAERKFIEGTSPCALLNFQGSAIAGQQVISVIKNGLTTIDLDCIENVQNLSEWTTRYCTILNGPTNAYDFSSADPPTDNQTVLRQAGRFVRTHKVEQGRTVYREKRTGYYWCVDNLHNGLRSHIEVFDQLGDHIGEADLNGSLDFGKKDTTKKISL